MFTGSIVAIVTPFKNGEVDEVQLRELVEWHIQQGTDGLLPCGTTGESPTLSYEEHNRVIQIVVEQARKRVPVIGGTGSNSTKETLELTQHAKDVGCDAALLVVPYYNKPTQNGLYEHFKTIASQIDIPLIIYNIPGRTGVNLEAPTFVSLCREHAKIVGIKEASGSIEQVSQLYNGLSEINRETNVSIFSGDDSMTYPIMTLGGKGVISVIANIIPEQMHQLTQFILQRDFVHALKLHYYLYPLMKIMFIETNPIPVKTALSLMKKTSAELRLPLTPMAEKNRELLFHMMKQYKLI